MDLEGHYQITSAAVNELKNNHLPNVGFDAQLAVDAVLIRDMMDLLNLNHFNILSATAQQHHFMRAAHQSPYEAYIRGCKWIKDNFIESIRYFRLSTSLRNDFYTIRPRVYKYGIQPPDEMLFTYFIPILKRRELGLIPEIIQKLVPRTTDGAWEHFKTATGITILGPIMANLIHQNFLTRHIKYQFLGNALHALQDSFSESHVKRTDTTNKSLIPGDIEHIYLYAGKEKHEHGEKDAWWKKVEKGKFNFSRTGRLAVNATKSFINIVLSSTFLKTPQDKNVFDAFKNKWIRASPKLSKKRPKPPKWPVMPPEVFPENPIV